MLKIKICKSHKTWLRSIRKTFAHAQCMFLYASGLQSRLQTCGELGKAVNCDSGIQILACLLILD